MADLAIVTHAQSSSLSPAALGAQRAVELQAQQADGVQGFKDAMARRQHQIELAAIGATAARQAHLAVLARAAAAQRAVAQQAAARRAVAHRASSGSSSPSATVAQPVVSSAPSGSPQQAAQQMLDAAGQGGQFSCLDSLWSRESGWNVSASNPGTGAYGIPQALPAAKMASAGADWQTDPVTQIRWGLSYIDSLYGSPCGAWSHEEADGWY
ncbi:MAG TPA: lytic transglycosylase domain-containing protein [Chloroflexota bacterium]|nr:lytic transglycosylase domain-containing protein [Chloroflexota bacterium]